MLLHRVESVSLLIRITKLRKIWQRRLGITIKSSLKLIRILLRIIIKISHVKLSIPPLLNLILNLTSMLRLLLLLLGITCFGNRRHFLLWNNLGSCCCLQMFALFLIAGAFNMSIRENILLFGHSKLIMVFFGVS